MTGWTPWRRPTARDVVEAHGPGVYAHLKRIFGPEADVDDLFQQVFEEVLKSLPRFRGQSKIRTWLYRITVNVAYREMRLQYRRPSPVPLDEAEEPTAPGDLEADVAARAAKAVLYECLAELSPKLRMVVVLRDIEGKTLPEVAEALGRPLPTVVSQSKTARSRLGQLVRKRLQPARPRLVHGGTAP